MASFGHLGRPYRISGRTKICVCDVHPRFCFDSLCRNWWIVYLTIDQDTCTSSFSSQCPSSAGNSSDRWKPEQHFHKHLLGPPATRSPERHHPRVQGWSQHVSMDSHLSHTKRKTSLIFVLFHFRSGVLGMRRVSMLIRQWMQPYAL